MSLEVSPSSIILKDLELSSEFEYECELGGLGEGELRGVPRDLPLLLSFTVAASVLVDFLLLELCLAESFPTCPDDENDGNCVDIDVMINDACVDGVDDGIDASDTDADKADAAADVVNSSITEGGIVAKKVAKTSGAGISVDTRLVNGLAKEACFFALALFSNTTFCNSSEIFSIPAISSSCFF